MNIFIIVLVFIFMAGYYFLGSPGTRIPEQELEYAISRSELQSLAECTAEAHSMALLGMTSDMKCVEKYNIISENYCTNERNLIVKCDSIARNNKASTGYMITVGNPVSKSDTNAMIEVMEKWYPDASNFGLAMTGEDGIFIMTAAGNSSIPASVAKAAEITPGQLTYITQYSIRPTVQVADANSDVNIICGRDQLKVFRFNAWQCVDKNETQVCAGDTVWDSDQEKCVANLNNRPICGSGQTAVLTDDTWQCIDPLLERQCPGGMMARLDYSSMEWICVSDPTETKAAAKCATDSGYAIGSVGSTVRVRPLNCTDCEVAITNPDTCETVCVPDATKLNDIKCYARKYECSGSNRAFYFGFPNSTIYVKDVVLNIPDLARFSIPFDVQHSQNRKFNCLDCGDRQIDSSNSLYPYTATCK